jgi:hypothetical protein
VRVAHQSLEPLRFGPENGSTERQQSIVAPPIVFATRVGDQPKGDQPRNGGVKRARPEPQVAGGALFNILDDTVAMALAVREGQQNVELMWRERQKANRIISHTSNLDVLALT